MGVVVGFAHAADGPHCADSGEALGVANRRVLRSPVAVGNEAVGTGARKLVGRRFGAADQWRDEVVDPALVQDGVVSAVDLRRALAA
ncbi:MAG: hypothetical protein IPK07_25845 [Deltaproteobacteria bacterium]|nr:hypothetical protein [Deltaproteobacteria bacterium]